LETNNLCQRFWIFNRNAVCKFQHEKQALIRLDHPNKSFFSRFKAELIENGIFESVEDAKSEIFSYIEGYYNRIRRHSSLGYLSPIEYEKELKIKKL